MLKFRKHFFQDEIIINPFAIITLVNSIKRPQYRVKWFHFQTDAIRMDAKKAADIKSNGQFTIDDLDSVSDYELVRVEIVIDSLDNIIDAYIVKSNL